MLETANNPNEKVRQLGALVRYADDFVALCRTESQAREALRRIELVMDRLGLKLHPEKTRMARHSGKDVKQIIATLNPVLRGWGNYFRTGNAHQQFNQIDSYVYHRLGDWMDRRGGQRPQRMEKWTRDRFVGMGLYQLRGTVKYPAQATPRRSSLSRVQENCTHGLKGVLRNGPV